MKEQAVRNYLDEFLKSTKNGTNTRNLAWDHCHKAFLKYRGKGIEDSDAEHLALHLTGYLASWGMYRASSFLLQEKDYLYFKDLVKDTLMNKKYDKLFDIDSVEDLERNKKLVCEVYDEIGKYKEDKPTMTLITKIMLAVYGCVPAYDTNVCKCMRENKIKSGISFEHNIDDLIRYLTENETVVKELKEYRDENNSCKDYPLMKLVDMLFWQIGDGIKPPGEL